MQPVIYDVAVSMDGFISGPDGDISRFPHDGRIVDDYFQRISTYSSVIMGKHTYEFGYQFGLEPGANPYPGHDAFVFSQSISLPRDRAVTVVNRHTLAKVRDLKGTQTKPIYLCGGGQLAQSLLQANAIDVLRVKRAPIFLGSGTPIFSGEAITGPMRCTDEKRYDNGCIYQEFALS